MWTNGRKDGIGEFVFSNYSYKGSFASDQVGGGVVLSGSVVFSFSFASLMDQGGTHLTLDVLRTGTMSLIER